MVEQKSVKQIMKENRVAQWEVAKTIGMHESVLSRKLREEPDGEFREKIIDAIKTIKEQSVLIM